MRESMPLRELLKELGNQIIYRHIKDNGIAAKDAIPLIYNTKFGPILLGRLAMSCVEGIYLLDNQGYQEKFPFFCFAPIMD